MVTQPILTAQKPDILLVDDLKVSFRLQNRWVEVVKGVSFRVPAGKTVALVGESGSGKTVISQAIMGLLPKKTGAITGGSIRFNDPAKPGEPPIDIAAMIRDGKTIRSLRGGRIGMIFQEPMSSLSPVHTVGNQIEEALRLHQPVPHGQARSKTEHMLDLVGFKKPTQAYDTYPFLRLHAVSSLAQLRTKVASAHAWSAMGCVAAPTLAAWTLAALPSRARRVMPCRIAAMRNML